MQVKTIIVSDKGQICLPTEIRKDLDIKKGDSLILIKEGDKLLLEKSSKLSKKIKDDFQDLVKYSEQIAKELWDNDADEIWDTV